LIFGIVSCIYNRNGFIWRSKPGKPPLNIPMCNAWQQ